MKRIVFCLTYIMLFAVTAGLMAQETKSEKKVVIVKKIVDENGTVTETRTEASGADADKLIKEMAEEEGMDVEITETIGSDGKKEKRIEKKRTRMHSVESRSSEEKQLEINEEEVNGKMVKSYILTQEIEGKKEVIKWDGNGEMPQAIKEELDRMKSVEVESESGERRHRVRMKKEGGDSDKDSDEIHELKKGGHNKFIEKKMANNNKVSLGVMINTDKSGVVIDEVVKGSAAEDAKLKAGDRITEIDETPVSNIDELLAALSKYNDGDKVKIRYFRNNKAENVTAKLKAKK